MMESTSLVVSDLAVGVEVEVAVEKLKNSKKKVRAWAGKRVKTY